MFSSLLCNPVNFVDKENHRLQVNAISFVNFVDKACAIGFALRACEAVASKAKGKGQKHSASGS